MSLQTEIVKILNNTNSAYCMNSEDLYYSEQVIWTPVLHSYADLHKKLVFLYCKCKENTNQIHQSSQSLLHSAEKGEHIFILG